MTTRWPALLRRFFGQGAAPPDPGWPASPWSPLPAGEAVCNICHWSGDAFEGVPHSESAMCPCCGAIARDRFLFLCLQREVAAGEGLDVLETSPRLGEDYRATMRRWFDYRCSDFDLGAHRADLQIDLQDIALPDDSLDVVLSSHVLEHVPDTARALGELHRVLRPGGRLILLVPVPQGTTAPPEEPEYHGDDTLVFWRFGPDLTTRLAECGFDVRLLATQELAAAVALGHKPADEPEYGEIDHQDVIDALADYELTVVATADEAARHVLQPSYMYLAWSCRVAEPPGPRLRR